MDITQPPYIKHIQIKDKIYIHENDIENVEYFKSLFTYRIVDDQFFATYEYNSETGIYTVPSNSFFKLNFLTYEDNRNLIPFKNSYVSKLVLRNEQKEALEKFLVDGNLKSGLLQAGCGWGKSVSMVKLITEAKIKCLILVHTKLLFRQWIKEIQNQIPNAKVGMIGDGHFSVQDITVGLYLTVYNNIDKIKDSFGLTVVDECHRAPSNIFSKVLNNINSKCKIGISATPRRKDKKHQALKDYFGRLIIAGKDVFINELPKYSIIPTNRPFHIKNPKLEWSRALNKLAEDRAYMDIIVEVAKQDIKNGRAIVITSDRISMLEYLNSKIPNSELLIGKIKDDNIRDEILSEVGKSIDVILTTTIFDEGISCHRLDTIYFTCPSNNDVRWEQRIGRIRREHIDKKSPLIRDFWLKGVIVEVQQFTRLKWYHTLGFEKYEEIQV